MNETTMCNQQTTKTMSSEKVFDSQHISFKLQRPSTNLPQIQMPPRKRGPPKDNPSDSSSSDTERRSSGKPRRSHKHSRQARFVSNPEPTPIAMPPVPPSGDLHGNPFDISFRFGFPVLETVRQTDPPGPFNILPRGLNSSLAP
jgi:hypothetical protein